MRGDKARTERWPQAEGPLARLLIAAIPLAFLCSFAVGWFLPASLVGIGDWDWFFSDAWVSASTLLERGWPGQWSIQLSGGVPLAGNPESLSHSPLLVLPLVFGPIVGTKLLVVLLLVIGLVGCQRLGLRWIGDPLGAAVFAFAFVFSGHFAIHLRAGHLPWAAFYLVPWILLFADRLLLDSKPSPGASLGFVVSLVLLFTGLVYHALVFFLLPVAVIYGVLTVRSTDARRLGHVVILTLCAVGITMPRIVAIIVWEWHSPRVHPGYGGMPLLQMAEMLLTPIQDYKLYVLWGGSGIWEYWSYVGIVTGLLALAAATLRHPSRPFALACLAAAALLAWRGPWGSVLGSIAPYLPFVSSVRVLSRFLVCAVFAIALLAGMHIGWLRSRTRERLSWLPPFLFLAIVAEYGLVVRPIWSNVFALPPETVYADWGIQLPGPRYHTILLTPWFQQFTDEQDMFNSKMLPSLMAGAVVSNSYVTMVLPWSRPPAGRNVVESWPHDDYRISNNEIEIFGDLHEGRQIRVNLHCAKDHWKVADPTSAALLKDGAVMRLWVLRACKSIRLVADTGLETVGWIVSAIALIVVAIVLRRETVKARVHDE